MPSAKDEMSPKGGVIEALTSLVTPLHFKPLSPTCKAVQYDGPRRGVAPLADIYIPSGKPPYPAVLLVHGGGFVLGTRLQKPMRYLATRFAEAGIATMSIDYRLVFQGGRLKEAVSDVVAAFNHLEQNHERYGIDRNRISVVGLSAGAALTVVASSKLPQQKLRRVVGVFGPYDFASIQGRRASFLNGLLFRSNDRQVWNQEGPMGRQSELTRPLLLIHGTADQIVPVGHTKRLVEKRASMGLPVESLLIHGAPHAFFNAEAHQPMADEALARIIPFVRD